MTTLRRFSERCQRVCGISAKPNLALVSLHLGIAGGAVRPRLSPSQMGIQAGQTSERLLQHVAIYVIASFQYSHFVLAHSKHLDSVRVARIERDADAGADFAIPASDPRQLHAEMRFAAKQIRDAGHSEKPLATELRENGLGHGMAHGLGSSSNVKML
jgi:hypothetical protein